MLRKAERIIVNAIVLLLLLMVGDCGIPASHSVAYISYAQSTAADLIIEDITWSPSSPSIEDTVTFSVMVRNQGSEQAGSFRVAYYVDDSYLYSELVSALNAGAAVAKTFTWKAQAGSHSIKAVADSDNQVAEVDEANNTDTVAFSPTAPDLIIQSITWSPANPSEGDVVELNIAVKNQGTSLAAASFIELFIDGASRGVKDISRINAGASLTGTYTWVAQSGNHELRAVADSKGQLKENEEANNEKIVTFATAIPDLIVQNIVWSPQSPSKDDDVTFTVTIKNQGTGRADYSHVAYYIDGVHRTTAFIDPLDAGATASPTFTWEAELGSHTVKIVADANEWVLESDEDNNERAVNVMTLSPDLIIEDITWTPEGPSVKDTVTFTVTIRNQGGGSAGASRLAYFIGDVYSGQQDVPEIAVGTSVARTFTWKAEAGSRPIRAVADYNNDNRESDETNNGKVVTFSTLVPDLVVQDIIWSPEDPSIGTQVTYKVFVLNKGSGRADAFHTACYIDGALLRTDYVDSLDAGATANLTFTAMVEAISHDVKAVADHGVSVEEGDEANNEKTVTFRPIAPDLVIGDVSWSPQSPAIGEALTITVTIENRGDDMATYSLIAYYVDGASKGYHDVQEIEPGASATDTFTWTVEAGTHSITMAADSGETILEGDETNNGKTFNYPSPDLLVQDVAWSPLRPSVGETVTLTATVHNQGSGRANASSLALYVDGILAGEEGLQEMGAGGTAVGTFAWAAQSGSHQVKVVVDGANQVVEVDEANNELGATVATLTPDLVIQDIAWSEGESPVSGQVVFTIVMENQGDGRAVGSTLAFYVDGALEEEREVQELGAGATMTEAFTWTGRRGTYEVTAVVDEMNTVDELDETNNELMATFTTPTPDLVIKEVDWSQQSSQVTFNVVVENRGDGWSGATGVAYYIGGVLIGEQEIGELGAGANVTRTFAWQGRPGSHQVEVVADDGRDIMESDEDNNAKLLTVSLAAANPAPSRAAPIAPNTPAEKEIMWGIWIPVILAACAIAAWVIFGLLKFKK